MGYAEYEDRQAERIAANKERMRKNRETGPELCPGCGGPARWFLNPITEQLECNAVNPVYGFGCGYQWEFGGMICSERG